LAQVALAGGSAEAMRGLIAVFVASAVEFQCCERDWCVSPRWEFCAWGLLSPWTSNAEDTAWSQENVPGCTRRPRTNARELGYVNHTAMLDWVESWGEVEWEKAGGERAATYAVHKHTADVRVLDHSFSKLNEEAIPDPLHADKWPKLQELMAPIVEQARQQYGYKKLNVIRAIFVRLAQGGDISPHRDRGPGLIVSHRLHYPLISEGGVQVLGVHHPPGHLFELHNGKQHSVKNSSPRERIHFIMDAYPDCEKVENVVV